MPNPTTLKIIALLVVAAIAVFTDVRERRIPNWLTVSGVAIGLTVSAMELGGFPVLAFLGVVVALAIGFPMFALGAFGAGDAKLFAAVGAFVGPAGLLPVVLYGGVAGGLLALWSSIRRGAVLLLVVQSTNLILYLVTLGRLGERRTLGSDDAHAVPYGVAIAVGAVGALFFPITLGGGLS